MLVEYEPVGSIATCIPVLMTPNRDPCGRGAWPTLPKMLPLLSGHARHMWTCRRMALTGKIEGLPFPLIVKVGCSVVESGSLFFPLPADLYS